MLLRNNYYTLIGSLPALPSHFASTERLPISLLQLRERLKMLEETRCAGHPRDERFLDLGTPAFRANR